MNFRLLNWGGPPLVELASAFAHAADLLGHKVCEVTEPQPDGVHVFLVGQAAFLRNFVPPKHSVNILYSVKQQLPSGYDRFDAVLTLFEHIRAEPAPIYAPLGHSPAFETNLAREPETIDVFHLGHLREGRKADIGRCYGHLIRAEPAFGDTRDRLILQSRINLIVRSWPRYHLPVLRFLLLACKRRFVLCEPHESYGNIDPHQHLVLAHRELESEIRYWLDAGAARRQEIADRVYDDLRQRRSYPALLQPVLEILQHRLSL